MSDHDSVHDISVVIPVYQGERTLAGVLADLAAWHEPFLTPDGHRARVSEVLLVHDCGPDASDRAIREVAAAYDWVRPVWLSRNFGQHAATLAGMSSSGGDWVATLDEDGQHDPADLGTMLDRAMAEQADVVYAAPLNPPPHGFLRNSASRAAKHSIRMLSGRADATYFNSYRLMLGDVARSVAAYAGSGVYLDIALGWVSRRVITAPVTLRSEDRASGYRWRTLMSHYWRMVVSGGTRILRVVSLLGFVFALLGFLLAAYVVTARLTHQIEVSGWASTIVAVLLSSGALLFAMGVVAEYLGVAVNMAMGKPLYLVVRDRADGPLARPKPER
ncbi:MAG TPA: glycosyltransferase [Nocardioides sp.]|uniref:glycosyltransferase n=1 Tax=Nocardioides sp. TaxID=35761 RepID=UPI002BA4E279|nr:glycosyltransferase [Nocardioides sp.]HTW17963.1 glycosyltransferase [Nocardioides sp.]